ncbi:MAG: ATP-binding cassette domain-containing protein [Chitinophagales bacterium]|nr:ATP-binding cassette domain-containing protein [Chitinophagales bacterium]
MGQYFSVNLSFLTQAVVDYGINNQDIGFVYLILIGQLMLFFSQTLVDFVRSWILLHIGVRINISLVADFLTKLMKLPISFFDAKMTGDILQRINDNYRIQQFLTASTLNILFSFLNLIIFGIVLLYYSKWIFLTFLLGSTVYIMWVALFLNKRKQIDYVRFNQMSDNQSKIVQLVTGMQEIKLNNAEQQKRWEWERIQAKLYKVSVQSLALEQWQQGGATFINQFTNIVITFLSAKLVIDGNITLGMMLAVQYIIGQLNGPVTQLIGFLQTAQDAKISLERLGEIHNRQDEDELDIQSITELPTDKSLHIENMSFQYGSPNSVKVLNDVNLTIPEGKITAIVGTSGSGKTTLLKLLMKFYEPTEGTIKVGNTALKNINNKTWRAKLGTVMQDGFIFSDTIAKNIAVSDEVIDKKKLLHAVNIANISEFIETLPLGFNTKIGQEGIGLSMGQKQRILIARAVYKDPELMLFDEATNNLDAKNEKQIMEKLEQFYQGKTVVIVAHRLSTVKNAHQIIVLEKGNLVEQGTHAQLTAQKGMYYHLVKNQLELGN